MSALNSNEDLSRPSSVVGEDDDYGSDTNNDNRTAINNKHQTTKTSSTAPMTTTTGKPSSTSTSPVAGSSIDARNHHSKVDVETSVSAATTAVSSSSSSISRTDGKHSRTLMAGAQKNRKYVYILTFVYVIFHTDTPCARNDNCMHFVRKPFQPDENIAQVKTITYLT